MSNFDVKFGYDDYDEVVELDFDRVFLEGDMEDCRLTLLKLTKGEEVSYAIVAGHGNDELYFGTDEKEASEKYDEILENNPVDYD